jgi:Mg2+/Co2+ transporter CorB
MAATLQVVRKGAITELNKALSSESLPYNQIRTRAALAIAKGKTIPQAAAILSTSQRALPN